VTERKIFVEGNPRGAVHVSRVRRHAQRLLTAVAELREGHEPWYPKPDDLEILAHDYLTLTNNESNGSMTNIKRHAIPDPYAASIGLSSLTIWVPADFRGDAEIVWWWPGKTSDEDKQRITCSTAWLLQGIFHDVHGSRPGDKFDARVVALVLHAFYRVRIEAAARLEAAYEWQAYPLEDSAESRVAHGLHPEPGPHCVRCSKRLTPAEVASQLPDHDEFCDDCLEHP